MTLNDIAKQTNRKPESLYAIVGAHLGGYIVEAQEMPWDGPREGNPFICVPGLEPQAMSEGQTTAYRLLSDAGLLDSATYLSRLD